MKNTKFIAQNNEHKKKHDDYIIEIIKLKPCLTMKKNKRKLFALIKVMNYIFDNVSMEINLDEISKEVNISKFEICRLFNEYMECTPIRWLWSIRIQFAKEYICIAQHWSLTDISHACGFNSLAHFSRYFSKTYGISPLKYKATIDSSLNQHDCYQIIYGNKCESIRRSIVVNSFR